MTQRYTQAERRYLAIKEDVKGRAKALDEAVSQSAQVRSRGPTCNCFTWFRKVQAISSNRFIGVVYFGTR